MASPEAGSAVTTTLAARPSVVAALTMVKPGASTVVVGQAAGVLQQLADGDLAAVAALAADHVRQVRLDRLVERELPSPTSCNTTVAVNILVLRPIRTSSLTSTAGYLSNLLPRRRREGDTQVDSHCR
jgi:hypothetical protein